MLKRILLALLIACLAFPATAAPLASQAENLSMTAAIPCHGEAPAQDQSPAPTAKHQCIGCVPPVHACSEVPARMELRGMVGVAALVHRLASLSDLPATPPPRS